MITTDQKRVARGEHLKLAKYYLQARDGVHNGAWRVLLLAGPEPTGECKAVRELMPRCHILCVDKQWEYAARAACSADAIMQCDISPVTEIVHHEGFGNGYNQTKVFVNPQLKEKGPFDLIDLDLCANPSLSLPQLIRVNSTLVQARGVMMLTFSYGRDVLPLSIEARKKYWSKQMNDYDYENEEEHWFLGSAIPDYVQGRIIFLLGNSLLKRLRSVILYQGERMPMCALLLASARTDSSPISFIKLGPEDFANVVLEFENGDPCLIYDCPAERLMFLRRSRAAHKAVATRRNAILNLNALADYSASDKK